MNYSGTCSQKNTITLILTALGFIVSTIVLAIQNAVGVTPAPTPPTPSSRGTDWVKKQLKTLAGWLKAWEAPVHAATSEHARKPARLAAEVSGGRKMMFKGQTVTTERIDAMEDAEIEELHARYEARLGAAMSKSLGSSLLRVNASVASMLLPLPPSRQPELVADLEQDPFLSSALQSACCELYYRYGMYLAPLTVALTTAKHCDWKFAEQTVEDDDNTPSILTNANDNDGRSERTGASADSENNCESERP